MTDKQTADYYFDRIFNMIDMQNTTFINLISRIERLEKANIQSNIYIERLEEEIKQLKYPYYGGGTS